MSSRSRLAALGLALGLALGPAFVAASRAQDKDDGGLGGGPEGTAVTDAMLKACPKLATAKGRRRRQLVALYFQLDWAKADAEETKKTVRELFDFEKEDDRAVLAEVLLEKGPRPQARGLRAAVAASGGPGLVWLLRVFAEKAQPAEKGFCLDALFAARSKEALRFLEKCLDDTTSVPDGKAAQEAPPGYEHLRVCDHALRVLRARLEAVDKLASPKDPQGEVRSIMPIAKRDASIDAFKKWLAADKGHQALLAGAPSALADLPDEKSKKEARELLGRLKVEAE